ncbi:hypothetical protein HZC30_04380 [Candidatus Woesearchaeota archaeon]|nr:hypothetical protein [Candidatus Woesearchaeota archaeon]
MGISTKQLDELVQALRTQINGTFGGQFESGVYSELDAPLKESPGLLTEANTRGAALLSKIYFDDKELKKAHELLLELFRSCCEEKHYLNYVTNTRNKIDQWWKEHPGTYFNAVQAKAIAAESFYQAFKPAISGVVALEDLASQLFDQVNLALAGVPSEKGVYAAFCQPLLQAPRFYLMRGGEGYVLDLPQSAKNPPSSNRTIHVPPTIEHAQKYIEIAGWKIKDYISLIDRNKQRNKFYPTPTFETEQAQEMADAAFHEAFKETRESYGSINPDLPKIKDEDDED